MRPNIRVHVFTQNDANGIANSEDPDQSALPGAVWSGSLLFALTYLSKNLGSLQYFVDYNPLWPFKAHNPDTTDTRISFQRKTKTYLNTPCL